MREHRIIGYVRRSRRLRVALLYLVTVGALVIAVETLLPRSTELTSIRHVIYDSQSWKLVVASLLELMSSVAYGLSIRALVVPSRAHLTRTRAAIITVASQAIGNSLPLGSGVSAVYSYRRFVEYGVEPESSAIAVGGSNAVAIASLALLLTVSTLIGEAAGGTTSISLVALIPLVLLALLCVIGLLQIGRVAGSVRWVWEYCSARFKGDRTHARTRAAQAYRMTAEIRIPKLHLLLSAVFSFSNWAFDLAALFVALSVAHASVPVIGIVGAYFLGALAANLPITPGGLGVVEGSLSVALVAAGGGEVAVLTGVLLYRLVSYWIWLPIGWATHFLLSWRLRRSKRLLVDISAVAGVEE